MLALIRRYEQFQSTLSMRRATKTKNTVSGRMLFQSTLSMRRATGIFTVDTHGKTISIHALHEESDSLHGRPKQ